MKTMMKLAQQLSLLTLLLCKVSAQECSVDGLCDTHERCPTWKEEGECYRNQSYMEKYCPVSCSNVDRRSLVADCDDIHPRCAAWAELGECKENRDMLKYCAKSCNSCQAQTIGSKKNRKKNKWKGLDHEPVEIDPNCVDTHENCGFWASKGECKANPNYMTYNCPQSCKTCDLVQQARELAQETTEEVQEDDVVLDEDFLEATARFGERQSVAGAEASGTLELVMESIAYMQSDKVLDLPQNVQDTCLNRHELCTFWAQIGECQNNKAYMTTNCAPACKSCHLIDMASRCPEIPDARPALRPGELNKMFERIVRTAPGNRTLTDVERRKLADDSMPEYTVIVHSRPSSSPAIEISPVLDKSLPPWVITLDNFITDEECDAMIALGHKYKFKRSEDVGARKFDGSHDSVKSERRTSENAWCSTREGCRAEEVAQRLHDRMSKVMHIPAENSEDLQLLKYEKGQFYRTHHDYIPHQKDRQCGPRILTFFIYLSDVEEGGGTNFPDLGITVEPKKGRALLWPSVYDSAPLLDDKRMRHQALDVIEGTKYAANGWIHMYDYVGPQERGCN